MDADNAALPMFPDPASPDGQGSAVPQNGARRGEQALYRRYRSRDFDELVGQEPIVHTLKNALASNRLAHAYLFSGPRGTGKTSMARLLAKAVNCLDPDITARPCNKCAACTSINEGRAVDLIEIDAASNRGVDDVRDLRDRVHFAPAELRKKFYIIDEVHMMTTEAFNALLKTLEEPPPYVIFVLATTDPQKLPATVLSRCQRFDFRRFPLVVMVEHMRGICRSEGYEVEPGVLELIGRQAAGGMRDALSLLDQLMSYSDGVLMLNEAERMLGARAAGEIAAFVDTLIAKDMPSGLRLLHKAVDNGADLRFFNRQLVEHLRSLLLLRAGGDTALLEATGEEIEALRSQAARTQLGDLMAWIRIFGDADQNLRNGVHGALPLELALVEAGIGSGGASARQQPPEAPPAAQSVRPQPSGPALQRPAYATPEAPAARSAPAPQPQPPQRTTPAPTPITREAAPAPIREPAPLREAMTPAAQAPAAKPAANRPTIDDVLAIWARMVATLNSNGGFRNLAALLQDMGQAWPHHFEGETLVLGAKFDFHRSKLDEARYRRQVEDQLAALLGAKVLIRTEVMDESTRPKPQRPQLHALPQTSRARMAAAIFEEDVEPGSEEDNSDAGTSREEE